MGPRNHVLDGGPDPPWEWELLMRHVPAHCNVPTHASRRRRTCIVCLVLAEDECIAKGDKTEMRPFVVIGCIL